MSDPPWAQTTHTSLYSLRRWIATRDAARAERARLRERVVSRLAPSEAAAVLAILDDCDDCGRTDGSHDPDVEH